MSKTNNNLMLLSGILAFILGLLLASPAYAQNISRNEINAVPYYHLRQDIPILYYNSTPITYNNSIVIEGCEGRNTGFSMTTGQSCIGNYVNSNTNNVSTNTTNNSNTTNTTVAKTTDTNETVTIDESNDSFNGLTANALEGSNSFLPTGLMQWIFLAIVIVAIIFLWRYVFAEEKYLSEPLKHA
ncbi:MAG: hypothetical protein WC868_13140 [Bacteroidales bacterium]